MLERSIDSKGEMGMRYFRRLPPLLRVASILGLLFPLASIALLIDLLATSLPSFPDMPPDFLRMLFIAANLGMLSGAFSYTLSIYSVRFRRPGGGQYPLDSWQSQVRAIGLLSALPLCAIALALFSPATPPSVFVVELLVGAVTVIGAVILLVAHVHAVVSVVSAVSSGPKQTVRQGDLERPLTC